jgi:hypothetical protein
MPIFKMVVLLCSLAATPNLDNCTEANAIAINRLTRVAPYKERCGHDSQHEQAQLLYGDVNKWRQAHPAIAPDPLGAPYPLADRKIKVLCIPSSPHGDYN